MVNAVPLLTIPQEVRDIIWDAVQLSFDASNLMRTCRQIRHEFLTRLPPRSKKPKQSCLKNDLKIVIEPLCSSVAWLRLEMAWDNDDGSRVMSCSVIRNLDSPLLGIMLESAVCRSQLRVTIELWAPGAGHLMVAYLTIQAKLMDALTVLERCRRGGASKRFASLEIQFREHRGKLNKSFWECRPSTSSLGRAWDRSHGRDRRTARKYKLMEKKSFPYFYECILLYLVTLPYLASRCTVDISRIPIRYTCDKRYLPSEYRGRSSLPDSLALARFVEDILSGEHGHPNESSRWRDWDSDCESDCEAGPQGYDKVPQPQLGPSTHPLTPTIEHLVTIREEFEHRLPSLLQRWDISFFWPDAKCLRRRLRRSQRSSDRYLTPPEINHEASSDWYITSPEINHEVSCLSWIPRIC